MAQHSCTRLGRRGAVVLNMVIERTKVVNDARQEQVVNDKAAAGKARGCLEQQHEDTEQDPKDLAAGKGKEAAYIDQAHPEPVVSAKPFRGRNNNIFPARRSRHHPSSSAPSTSPGVQPGPAASVGSESGAATPLGPESPNGTQSRTQKTLVCLRSHANTLYPRAHTHTHAFVFSRVSSMVHSIYSIR